MVPNHQPDIHVYHATDEILKRLIFLHGANEIFVALVSWH